MFKISLPIPLKGVSESGGVSKKFEEKHFPQKNDSRKEEHGFSRSEVEKIKKKFYQRGFLEGKREGEASISSLKSLFKDSIQKLEKEKKNFIRKSEKDMVEIAIAIARKIIKKQVDIDPEIIRKTAGEVLQKIVSSNSGRIVMRVNPRDWENLIKIDKDFFSPDLSEARIKIEKDKSIQSGGCIVETEKEIINASIEHQLEEISRALRGEKE